MPKPGMRWRHVVISTANSWLPGEPRGFRSRDHKIHSSGDYRNPPPAGEHAGLFRYSKKISGEPIVIPGDLRPEIGKAILRKLEDQGYQVLVLSVAATHAHVLVELPSHDGDVRHVVGQCKAVSSHAVRARLPGRVWGHGGKFKPVDDIDHQRNAFHYILTQEGAWIWSFREQT
jgi:REP element-mobilizing transposase RayT